MNASSEKTAPNPYAPPGTRVADARGGELAPPLWNPNAAANRSLLFTPAFGALLHMLNWRALGEAGKAASAKVWLVVSLAMLLVYVVLALALPDAGAADAAGRAAGMGYLYFSLRAH